MRQSSVNPDRFAGRDVPGARRVAPVPSTVTPTSLRRSAASTAFLSEPVLLHEPRRRATALWLCLLFGWLGSHRFYVGKRGSGWLYLLTGGIFLLGVVADLVLILTGSFEDSKGQPLA